MNEPDLSFIRSDIDLTEVAPLNRRRVVAFVNCFLYKMIDLINDFATRAERVILEVEQKLHAVDIKLKLLEAKLASIPDPVAECSASGVQSMAQHHPTPLPEVDRTAPAAELPLPPTQVEVEVNGRVSGVLLIKDDPAYTKYFKMLKLGVVEAAVKQKMQSEGLDPSLLDNPDAPSPNAITSAARERPKLSDDESDTSSVSSFSDSD